MKKILIVSIMMMFALLACSDKADKNVSDKAGKNAEVQPAASDLTGKVIETMDSGGYTYVQIENSGRKTWVAVPSTTIAKGSTVAFMPGAPMANFTSKTMGKTFDFIIFSPGLAK